MDSYENDFEEDEGKKGAQSNTPGCPQTLSQGDNSNWKTIELDEVDVGAQIGGGSVGIVHRGVYMGTPVAIKTLVSGDPGLTSNDHHKNAGPHDRENQALLPVLPLPSLLGQLLVERLDERSFVAHRYMTTTSDSFFGAIINTSVQQYEPVGKFAVVATRTGS